MPTTVPAWFNADFYATQKVAQMNTIGYKTDWLTAQGATTWTTELYNQYLADYRTEDGAPVTAWENFQACNAASYEGNADVTLKDINVSPNEYFNVEQYLQALADYNNANPDAYDKPAPTGGWTMQSVLNEIFDTFHTSVWEHYLTSWNTLGINPSNNFDTTAYLEARAQAMGQGATAADAAKAISDAGSNPIEDFFTFGAEHNIKAQPVAGGGVTPVPPSAGWTVWGEPVGPVTPVDPFDEVDTQVNVKADQFAYPAEGESYTGNTQFSAAYVQSSANTTLNAKDTFVAPEGAYNTLDVTISRDWKGFAQQKDADGNAVPSVQNVGRVVLNHDPNYIVRSWDFDATGISEDAYRFDLRGGNGPGAINLKNLSEAVNDIRISNLTPKDVNGVPPDVTYIDYVNDANGGKNDFLKIQLDNVGGSGAAAAAIQSRSNFGIEELTLDTVKDGDSWVNISDLDSVKTLKFTGAGNIAVTKVANGTINTYDASEATGNVTMAVMGPKSSTVVKGGAGTDTVVLAGAGTNWKPASLDSIERLNLSDQATINLVNVGAGLQEADIATTGGIINNLTADAFTVNLNSNADTTGSVKVNGTGDGSLQSVTFATGEPNNPPLATLSAANIATNAVDTVTLDPSEDVKQYQVGNFTANDANKLVMDAGAIALQAGSLDSLQLLEVTLEGTDSSGISINLPSIQNVEINGGDNDITLSNLGGQRHEAAITMSVENVANFTAGTTTTGRGDTVTFNIDATGDVRLGNISNGTTLNSSLQGSINLDISGNTFNSAAVISIDGGPLRLDFADVTGQVGSGAGATSALNLSSTGNIQYTGGTNSDFVVINAIGEDGSIIAPGTGQDNIQFTASAATNVGITRLTVDLGSDGENDTLVFSAQTANHRLFITLDGADSGDTLSGVFSSAYTEATHSAGVVDILQEFGIADANTADSTIAAGITAGGASGTIIYNHEVYAMQTSAASCTILIDLGSADDFVGITTA